MTTTSTHHSINLAQVLESIGVDVKRVGDREITGKCPVHIRTVGREDRSPSWSMNLTTGLWICFSCGARGTLSSLICELTGSHGSGIEVQKMLVESSFNALTAPKVTQEEVYVDRDAFFKFSAVPQPLIEARNLNQELVHRHGVRWNKERKSWAIPIMSPTGRLDGWQEKKFGSVLNYPVGVKKGQTLFGAERFTSKTAVLVESPLDVVRFADVGITGVQALGTFGAHVSEAQIEIVLHLADKIVIAMDNDEAGMASNKRLYKQFSTPRNGLFWWNYKNTTAKDIGDMTNEEIMAGYHTATVMPPWIA